jgi:hypothetical protein
MMKRILLLVLTVMMVGLLGGCIIADDRDHDRGHHDHDDEHHDSDHHDYH